VRVCVLNNQSLKNHLVDEYILSCSHFSGYVPGILIPGPSKMKGKDLVLLDVISVMSCTVCAVFSLKKSEKFW